MRGRLVTMPLPRGKKSRPTMFSRTDDLPADWEPTTTYGKKSESNPEGGQRGEPGLDTHDLRQIQGVATDCVEDEVLQLVDSIEKVVSEGCHGGQGCV